MRVSRFFLTVLFSAAIFAAPAPASAQKNTRAKPAPEAQPSLCGCGDAGDLQRELALALALMNQYKEKARSLREKYGAQPQGDALAAALRAYAQFDVVPKQGEKPEPGSAWDGVPHRSDASPVSYRPRGQELLQSHTADNRNNADNLKGIPAALKSITGGQPEPDQALRKSVEDKFRKAKQDLCDFADEAAMKSAMQKNKMCSGMNAGATAEIAAQQDACRASGFYSFSERSPAQRAEDKANAYKARVDAIQNDIRRIIKRTDVKMDNDTSNEDPRSLLSLQFTCALALSVSGQIDELKLSGNICDASKPFTIKTTPNVNLQMTPVNEKGGSYVYRGNVAGATFFGSGKYTLEVTGEAGSLTMDGAGQWHVQTPVGAFSKGGPETLKGRVLKSGCP